MLSWWFSSLFRNRQLNFPYFQKIKMQPLSGRTEWVSVRQRAYRQQEHVSQRG